MRPKTKKRLIRALLHGFLVVLAFVTILPFGYIVLLSFGEGVVGAEATIPEAFTLGNYRALFEETAFASWFINSLLLSLAAMGIAIVLVSLSVYAFSRLNFFGRFKTFNFVMLVQIFPLTLSMVSIFRIFMVLGLLNRLSGLIIVNSVLASAALVLVAKGYFDTIPKEMDEAALLDGAGRLKIFYKIIMPLAKPILAIVAMQSFVLAYNEYVIASAVMTEGIDSMPLAVGLQSLIVGQYGTNWSLYCAGAVIGSIPMLVLFYSLQKYFISNLTSGSVKD